jgi:hypothetical protein
MKTMGRKAFEFLALALVLGGVPVAAAAQAVTKDEVIAELQVEGFRVVETGTTLLGRLRITAMGPEGTREVILNTRIGKVLRDVMIEEAPELPVESPKSATAAPVHAAPSAGDAEGHGAGVEPEVPDAALADDAGDAGLP